MLPVLTCFLLPFGGGIPAGVLLAHSRGLAWPVTAGLYLLSDIILALLFEPTLRLLVALGRKVPFLVRFGTALKASSQQAAARYNRAGAGPISLIALSFGVDPMTGRTAALAAGFGPLAGWSFAIAGDLLYYAAIAFATLRLSTCLKNPEAAVLAVLLAMALIPSLVRRLRGRHEN
ncbi:MAG: hypothetical protein H6Q00_382 [Holophagaceae bacterium]|nr:hypothetical protein [Holophagaceae bacterium]